ncbi:hypothetical protein [Gemmatimonas aurantiaca]|uniref:hypothetical protein n=1 Tax=Gemmatimonas aurantiaca TaxID=173480 RepID=UPI00301BD9C1
MVPDSRDIALPQHGPIGLKDGIVELQEGAGEGRHVTLAPHRIAMANHDPGVDEVLKIKLLHQQLLRCPAAQ